MSKAKVSQDFLLNIIDERGVNVTTLAELMGMSATMVNGCFRHNKDAKGNPRNFPEKTLPKLNAALVAMADEMNKIQIPFGSSQTYTNQRGATYDPALVEPLKKIGEWMNLTALVERVLGWNQRKKENVLVTRSSKAYGTVSQADATAINNELLAVVGVLGSYEVVADGNDTISTE
jgi:hypothetical protein